MSGSEIRLDVRHGSCSREQTFTRGGAWAFLRRIALTGRHHAATRGGYGVGDGRVVEGLRRTTVAGRRAILLGIEVDFFDGECWPNRPLVTVRYDYVFWAAQVSCQVTVTTWPGARAGSPAFVKEPKLVCRSPGSENAGALVSLHRRIGGTAR
jgi:hypothetical protein